MKKNIGKSTHAHKADLLLCLAQLLDNDDPKIDDSKDWLEMVDRGGLCHISNDTFEVFLALEKELRNILASNVIEQLDDTVKAKLVESDAVQFIWYIISADWDEHISHYILQSIITESEDFPWLELGWRNTNLPTRKLLRSLKGYANRLTHLNCGVA